MNSVLNLLAVDLNIRHSPVCRQRHTEHMQLHRGAMAHFGRVFTCRCDFEERLVKAYNELIRRDIQNGIKRTL